MDSFLDLWNQVLLLCRKEITEVSYNLWVAPVTAVKFESDTVFLSVTTDFKRNIFEEKFKDLVRQKFTEVIGFPVNITVEVINHTGLPDDLAEEAPRITTEPECTFDSFVVGSSNRFAHAACIRVATVPGVEYNPLFIYGRSGLGKTHLLLAIENEMKTRNPDSQIIYTTGENFTNELILCIAEKNTTAFHNKYRNVDVLLVDDIQFIQNKVSTQEEFFHTFNTLAQAGKQIVLTSDRPPKEMDTLDDRLRTRFEWGLLADIQPPDIDTRMAIIKRKAKTLSLTLPDDVVEYIADKLKTNIRQLEGTVKRLSANLVLNGIEPSVELAQDIIKDIQTSSQPISVQTDNIIEHVAKFYGISADDIKSDKKTAVVSLARQVSMYIIRETTDLTLQSIGDFFGGKNYSTVIYSTSIIEKKISEDAMLKNTVYDLIKNVQDSQI
ncbi:MAG: chromosomal replication initiator protein DnaA [Oscillospiraceae bacterium]|jgi:chromosomal replication initiator protein|nr:chromosomal replication initiator protein DnaA [Oscillospiraceae bacterium]